MDRRYLLVTLLVYQAYALKQSPPMITKQPPSDELLFQVAEKDESPKPFIIECDAVGVPTPTFRWIKNGKPFEYTAYDNRISQQPGRGSLIVSDPRDEDLGQYQCFAENEWGTATSNSVFVRKAELNSFREQDSITLQVREGDPYKLTCQPPDGWPKPNVYWLLQGQNGVIQSINNSRMTLDPEGNLWFSNVTRNDASATLGNYAYICAAKSNFKNVYKTGDPVGLVVIPTGISPALNKREPVQQYVSRRNEVALLGKKVEMFCIFGGTPLPQTVWKKNGRRLKATDRIQEGNYGKSLVIKSVAEDDEGDYTCEVSNGVGTPKTYNIRLNVQAIPYFTIEPQIVNAAEDESAEIRCEAKGTPLPEIKWIHNGKPIEFAPQNDRRTVSSNKIVIRDLVKKDTGNYGCNATNFLGYVYKDVYINVQSLPPEFEAMPSNITVVDGRDAMLTCQVSGAPRPIVKWIRDGKELTGGRYNVTTDGNLVIRDVSFQDVGAYTCHAENKIGMKEASGTLSVKRHTVITDFPEDYEVAAGTPATFRCNAVADNSLPLEISWYHGDKPIEFESQPRFLQTNDYSLLITKTIELDSGMYKCVASTPLDEASASATLTVQDVPNAPQLLGIQCHQRDATLTWKPLGDNRTPILRYTIQYNTSFTPDTWETAYDNVASIESSYTVELTPWANYTFRVIAWNKIGRSPASVHSDVCTTQPDVPFKNPDNVAGNGTSPTNLVITWNPMPQIEHNGPGFHYRVQWKRNLTGAQWYSETIFDWRKNELVIENQPTFQPYKIKVIAANGKGESNVAAAEYIGWSGEDSPLQAPTNFTLIQITAPTSALVNWNPVTSESVRGHFHGYKIQTWTEHGGAENMRETLVKADATNTLVTNFVPFTRNYARILAYNGRYNGPPSDTLSFVTPEGQPGPVRIFEAYPIGSSALLLKWEKPEHPNGNIIGYKVYYQEVHGTALSAEEERKPVLPPMADKAKLAGLKPNTKYRITIRALTRAGEGKDYYVEQSTKAAAAQPDIPVFDLETLAAPGGLASVRACWRPSPDGHSGSHFQVKYRVKGEPKYLPLPPELSDDCTLVQGLFPGAIYEFKVLAYDGDYFRESDTQEVDTSQDDIVIRPKDNVASAGWFIGVMLALVFLLLLLVLVCIVRRNRGGKYDVYDRELAAGRRDFDEGGFHEYTHPLEGKSRHSMTSNLKGGDEEEDSMAEYGEGETGRFTEDGSFIGQYVPGAKPLVPPNTSGLPNSPPTYV